MNGYKNPFANRLVSRLINKATRFADDDNEKRFDNRRSSSSRYWLFIYYKLVNNVFFSKCMTLCCAQAYWTFHIWNCFVWIRIHNWTQTYGSLPYSVWNCFRCGITIISLFAFEYLLGSQHYQSAMQCCRMLKRCNASSSRNAEVGPISIPEQT